jgi:hypothetical protein
MKKLLTSLVLSTFVLFTGSVLAVDGFNTTPAKIKPEVASIINSTVSNPDNLEEYYWNGYKAWKFKYTSELNAAFEALGGKTGNTNGVQSVTTYYDYVRYTKYFPNRSPFQCVGFAKFASTISETRLGDAQHWIQGVQVTKDNLPAQGTVIATFDSNGEYEGHIGIFVSGNDDRIYMLDQNSGSAGNLRYHALLFSGTASNYYVVEI